MTESSKQCIFKTTCRLSQRITDISHKLWICISKGNGKVMKAHCTCMAGFLQTCSHVAAALFRIKAAVRMGLNSPFSTSKPCEWLPNIKDVTPVKIKGLKVSRCNFGRIENKT